MKSYLSFISLVSLAMAVNIVIARKDMGKYWKEKENDEQLPKIVPLKPDCHTSESLNLELKNFDQTTSPDATIYVNGDLKPLKRDGSFGLYTNNLKNFDQTGSPDATIYVNDNIKSSKSDGSLVLNIGKLKNFDQTTSPDATIYVNGDINSSEGDEMITLSLKTLKDFHYTESPDATIYVNDNIKSQKANEFIGLDHKKSEQAELPDATIYQG